MESSPSTVGPEIHPLPENPHEEHEFNILYSPELRTKYITLTDELIRRMAEDHTDTAIFLDKSARPVAWLVNELWDDLAPTDKETGVLAKKPEIKFLNIDREQWGPYIGRSEDKTGGIDVGWIPEENINDLRKVFAPIPGNSSTESQTMLTGKNVMVIDEVRSSGDTLNMAERILCRAFPDANDIKGVYWMLQPAERDSKSGALISGEVPVWYSDRSVEGRLVANRDATKSRNSASSRQRTGALWLSTRFRGHPDERGRKLKHEVKMLGNELREHQLPYIPSAEYSIEEISNRVQSLDGLSLDEYVELRKASTEGKQLNTAEFIELYRNYMKDRRARRFDK